MDSKLKVLIADDSVVYRSQIKSALQELTWIEVVGVASNGKIALEKISQTQVDLLILDLEMPVMDGLETLKEVTARGINCKVLVFSSVSRRGAEITLEALRRGATDFITKPGQEDLSPTSGANPNLKIRNILEPKISALFPVHSLKNTRIVTSANKYPSLIWDLFAPQIVVIGSSTGGPTALEKIFADLKSDLKCPILVAQHMPPIFTATLAERLQKISGIRVKEGEHGEELAKNTIYIAPGNFHMSVSGTLDKSMICLDQGPQVNSVRPAVDPLFASVSSIYKEKCLGIVLTGMGADGKVGAEEIKSRGGAVIIQSEESCVVFGMPGAVKASGAYDKCLNPSEIVNILKSLVGVNQSKAQQATKLGGR